MTELAVIKPQVDELTSDLEAMKKENQDIKNKLRDAQQKSQPTTGQQDYDALLQKYNRLLQMHKDLEAKLNQCRNELVLDKQGYDLVKLNSENNALLTTKIEAQNFVIEHRDVWPVLWDIYTKYYNSSAETFIKEINAARRIIMNFAEFVKAQQGVRSKADSALELQRNYFAEKKITWDQFVQQFDALKKAK